MERPLGIMMLNIFYQKQQTEFELFCTFNRLDGMTDSIEPLIRVSSTTRVCIHDDFLVITLPELEYESITAP